MAADGFAFKCGTPLKKGREPDLSVPSGCPQRCSPQAPPKTQKISVDLSENWRKLDQHGCGSKPMESHFGLGEPPILVGIGITG